MASASERVFDDLTEQEIRVRRVLGGHQRAIERRQEELQRRVRAAIAEIDVAGGRTPAIRERRLAELQKRVEALALEVYREHRTELLAALRRLYRAESDAVITAIADSAED